jgi:hypothetical protein
MPRRSAGPLFPFGRGRLNPRVWPASAGTWRAAGPLHKLTRPSTVGIENYTGRTSVPIGIDGQAQVPVTSGGATAQAGPSGIGASWALDQAGLSTDAAAADTATAQVFVGPQPTAPYSVATSYAAGGDAVGLAGYTLQPGEFVWCVWSGSSGTVASLKVSGTKTVLTGGP